MKKIRPYGSWSFPITSDLIASKIIGLSEITLASGDIYWLEMRPEEGGRSVIVRARRLRAKPTTSPLPLPSMFGRASMNTAAMVEALKNKGLPVAYLAYEGEQHGFRQAENIKRTLDAEIYFFSRVFDFELADPVEPVTIDNL